MTVNGISGSGANSNMQTGHSGMDMQMDSVSKNIQNQIANAQKQLQEVSSNKEMNLEEKMKKRQEIQKEITNLNQQLRQHQIEQRKEQQGRKSPSMDDMVAGTRKKSAKKGSGLSQASMQAMISADSSMKQAQVQGSITTQMEGKAGVLESEINTDKGRGISTEKKEEELADLQAKAQNSTASQISALADAGKVMEEAAKADQAAETTERKHDKTKKAETEAGDKVQETEGEIKASSNTGRQVAKASAADTDTIAIGSPETNTVPYTSVDIRL